MSLYADDFVAVYHTLTPLQTPSAPLPCHRPAQTPLNIHHPPSTSTSPFNKRTHAAHTSKQQAHPRPPSTPVLKHWCIPSRSPPPAFQKRVARRARCFVSC